MNEKREWLNNIEHKSAVQVVMVPNKYLETPAYDIRRVRDDEAGLPENSRRSVIRSGRSAALRRRDRQARRARRRRGSGRRNSATGPIDSAAADDCRWKATIAPPPKPAPVEQVGIFVKMWRFFFGTGTPPAAAAAVVEPARREGSRASHGGSQRRDRR